MCCSSFTVDVFIYNAANCSFCFISETFLSFQTPNLSVTLK